MFLSHKGGCHAATPVEADVNKPYSFVNIPRIMAFCATKTNAKILKKDRIFFAAF